MDIDRTKLLNIIIILASLSSLWYNLTFELCGIFTGWCQHIKCLPSLTVDILMNGFVFGMVIHWWLVGIHKII